MEEAKPHLSRCFNLITIMSLSFIATINAQPVRSQSLLFNPKYISRYRYLTILSPLSYVSSLDDEIDRNQSPLHSQHEDCVYTVYVRTGSIINGGTDSVISLTLYDDYGASLVISDLESWGGLMGSEHNYFERGNLDIFSGRGTCLRSPVCAVVVNTDGSGAHHGWYCNYVEVTSTGPHVQCAQQQFTVEQWLALDAAPFELYAVRNYCPSWSSSPAAASVSGSAASA